MFDFYDGGGLDVASRLVPPRTVDRLGERVTPRRRAVEVDRGHHVTRSSEHVRVPPPVPGVAVHPVGSAMDVLHQRPLLLGVEAGRVDDEHLHLGAVRAGEPDVLDPTQVQFGEHRGVEVGDTGHLAPGGDGDVVGVVDRGEEAPHRTIGGRRDPGDRPAPGEQLRFTPFGGNRVEVLARRILGDEYQTGAVRGPLPGLAGAIPVRRERGDRPR